MILLARLKFCWRILNFAGAVFEIKVVPAKDRASKILLARTRKYHHSSKSHSISSSKKKSRASR
jgi:hypothetical protein